MKYLFTDDLKFPDTLQIGKRLWRVQKPFICENIDNDGKKVQVLIPVGFDTDYGSIPQIFWNLFDPIGNNAATFINHDFVYQGEIFKRLVCDQNLLEGFKFDGDNWIYRYSAYRAVRMCGWNVWRQHTDESINHARHLLFETQKILIDPNNDYGIVYENGIYRKVA